MSDKRIVDDLSIEELERILAIRKREARQGRLQRMKHAGRVIDTSAVQRPERPAAPATAPGPAATPETRPADKGRIASTIPQFEDAIEQHYYGRSRQEDSRIWRRFLDRMLLVVEGAAVVGLIVLGAAMLDGINTLQSETAQAQTSADQQLRASIPTIAPTPQLSLASIVLPGGHTPPTEAGGGQFNFDEIPPSLRALVRDQIFISPEIERPPITPETARRIIIPQINVDHVIVQGVDWDALTMGVGQHINNVTPRSESGNVVLAAHNDIYGEIFRHLDELEPGMEFQIQTETQFYSYVITAIEIVQPDDVYVMESRGRATATLISCYPYQVNNRRIVVFADRINN